MSAKIFASLFAVALTALTHLSAVQQQPANTIPRIGYVSGAGDISVQAFRQGLRELGYIEGKNILVEYRHAEGKLDRAPALVAELLELKLDVLVTLFLPGIRAAKKATK
ncbi:MAG TPA: ABC transporter substrate-binding protein, partial [Candidatus Binatia bacterium]|nr:ABC transporter substrate-binding protein [Candidatus Binatia bacterium]